MAISIDEKIKWVREYIIFRAHGGIPRFGDYVISFRRHVSPSEIQGLIRAAFATLPLDLRDENFENYVKAAHEMILVMYCKECRDSAWYARYNMSN